MALARAVLLRVARERGDGTAVREQAEALHTLTGYARHVGAVVERELAAAESESKSNQWKLEAGE
jgi:hypothetical protein